MKYYAAICINKQILEMNFNEDYFYIRSSETFPTRLTSPNQFSDDLAFIILGRGSVGTPLEKQYVNRNNYEKTDITITFIII